MLEASNDFFIRTSDERHMAKVQEILTKVKDNGHVYKGTYEGWYCPRCADFKTETEIGPNNTCPIHEIPLIREKEENWFFRLSTFQEPLERLYAERPDFVMPSHHFNEARSFIGQGLEDVSLTRAKLRWGVSVPWDEDHVFYVWFDALLNYVSALSFARDGEDLTEEFWPASFHIIGKDILKFHAIYWPALLMAADLELPEHMFVTASCSRRAQDEQVAGQRARPVRDHRALWRRRAEALLLQGGHLRAGRLSLDRGLPGALRVRARQRVRQPGEQNRRDARPLPRRPRSRQSSSTRQLRKGVPWSGSEVAELLDRAELSQALEAIWLRVRRLNRYVEERAPWQLAKREEDGAAGRGARFACRRVARGEHRAGAIHAGQRLEAAGRDRAWKIAL